MKTLFLLVAAAGLSGCAVYPAAPGYETYGTYGAIAAPPYVVEQPVYIHGGVYPYRSPYGYPGGYNRVHPNVFSGYPPRPHLHAPRPGFGARDRDRDGIPNRLDRDRDGDGVPNRADRRPNHPGRR